MRQKTEWYARATVAGGVKRRIFGEVIWLHETAGC
jgi:hypothetical protein